MLVHFICRGNVFRSIIAETYLRSLNIPNTRVISSGTVASRYKDINATAYPEVLELLKKYGIEKYAKDHYGDDVTQSLLDASDSIICLNKIVYDELRDTFKVPEKTYIWDVADIDERGCVVETETGRKAYMNDAYELIVKNIDTFVSERGSTIYHTHP